MVDTHHAEIHRYLRRVAGRRAEADQLYEETFVRAFRAYRSLPADVNARVWLFAIASHVCRRRARSGRRPIAGNARGGDSRAADEGRSDAEIPASTTNLGLGQLMRRLPVTQRLAVTLRKLHDLDYEAVGQSLDCSAATARGHVLQALRRIRRGLAGLDLGDMPAPHQERQRVTATSAHREA
jgi:RNA polymerase sigma-70 factor (ECF subfamily)